MLLKVNREGLEAALASIGAHADSLPILRIRRRLFRSSCLVCVRRQRILSSRRCWRWAATRQTPVGAVTCAAKYVDILLLGTLKHYKVL